MSKAGWEGEKEERGKKGKYLMREVTLTTWNERRGVVGAQREWIPACGDCLG